MCETDTMSRISEPNYNVLCRKNIKYLVVVGWFYGPIRVQNEMLHAHSKLVGLIKAAERLNCKSLLHYKKEQKII